MGIAVVIAAAALLFMACNTAIVGITTSMSASRIWVSFLLS